MKKSKYRAVCFDLDGVLINSMPLHAKAWQDAGKRFKLRVPKSFVYAHEGEQGLKSARLLFGKKAANAALCQALLQAKEACFRKQARKIKTNPELIRVLDWLKRRGVLLALVTGTSWNEVRRVVSKGILKQFHVVITGDRVRFGKPNPEPYRSSFRMLGIRPAQAVVVENAPYGIQSARRAKAGFVAAFASSLPKRYLHEADWVGGSAKRVAEYLKNMAAAGLLPYNKRQT